MAQAFTAAEVAFVLREPVKTVKKALDSGPVRGKLVVKRGGTPVRIVEWADLLYLFAAQSLREELTVKGRNELYVALRNMPAGGAGKRKAEARFGPLRLVVEDLKKEVEARTRELVELAAKVEFRADGEPVLKGTTIEVYRISALLDGGYTVEEICQDYPSLQPAAVAVAKAYAEAHPKPGRPYPRTTVKRALKGVGLEALDEILDAGKQ